ncbi:MAG TPA: KpsF/GutQ family sugar-phosphate isomerase [Alcanivoracaceae bacterium]|nr:KpsF/GutQ family sugar-phosphate isomerase [Alcanivoracaceae bacterium]
MTQSFLAAGRRVLEIEAAAITKQIGSINSQFENACERILACQGRVIVTGMGKSGHVAAKIAATFASTGTPSFFVHPAEASHGDLGMITPIDVVLALSNSGETSEVITILPVLKRRNIPLISITGRPESTLATQSDVHIPVIVDEEACPLNLAPTSSTTAALAMGDALAIALLEARGFSAEDFALSHPGGSLGRRLLLRVEDIMHKDDDLPSVSITTSLRDAILNISQKGLGMTAVLNHDNTLAGVFTDGDLRRLFDQENIDYKSQNIADVMTKNPVVARPNMLAAEAVSLMETKKINGLIVVNDNNEAVGALNMHDLLKAGVV